MKANEYLPVKLIIGVLFNDVQPFHEILKVLTAECGEVQQFSEFYPFNVTDYYSPEMGSTIRRAFVSMHHLIDPSDLANIKNKTNRLEDRWLTDGKRPVNLDPGYLDLDKFVLASAKYGRQKIAIGHGMYADPTIYYFSGKIHPFEWSFPDFQADRYYPFFEEVRHRYKTQLRTIKRKAGHE